MKKPFTIILFLLGVTFPLAAQNLDKQGDRIQLARDRYAEGLAKIAEMKSYQEDGIPNENFLSVVRKQNWAGTGMQVDRMDFYYDEVVEEYKPYPIGYSLVMVRRSYNVAAREFLEEYVYDEAGKPLFYFTRFEEFIEGLDDASKIELRRYYDENGNIIRLITKMSDESGRMKEINENDNPEVMEQLSYVLEDDGLASFTRMKAVFDAVYNQENEN